MPANRKAASEISATAIGECGGDHRSPLEEEDTAVTNDRRHRHRPVASSLPGSACPHASSVKADLLDCMVALPGQLFYNTRIPVCLWSLAENKNTDAKPGLRDRC